ncbi:hypothetical protein TYRP_006812 [Tyrophagus putrescentiae]|nr:hypothetical protein TYRP_006812 [Tyrophagus putrescentiae]
MTLFISGPGGKSDLSSGCTVEVDENKEGIFKITNPPGKLPSGLSSADVIFVCGDSSGSKLVTMSSSSVGFSAGYLGSAGFLFGTDNSVYIFDAGIFSGMSSSLKKVSSKNAWKGATTPYQPDVPDDHDDKNGNSKGKTIMFWLLSIAIGIMFIVAIGLCAYCIWGKCSEKKKEKKAKKEATGAGRSGGGGGGGHSSHSKDGRKDSKKTKTLKTKSGSKQGTAKISGGRSGGGSSSSSNSSPSASKGKPVASSSASKQHQAKKGKKSASGSKSKPRYHSPKGKRQPQFQLQKQQLVAAKFPSSFTRTESPKSRVHAIHSTTTPPRYIKYLNKTEQEMIDAGLLPPITKKSMPKKKMSLGNTKSRV